MNRRGFIGALAAIAATATLDPERALWVPGKLISIPTPNVTQDRVEVYDRETYKLVELWWKERGGVYRQLSGQAPELSPFTEVPFVKIPPFALPLRLFKRW